MNHDQRRDRLFDVALEEYGKAEPRPGLEQRVLARLRSAPEPARFGWWKWAAVAAGCALIFALGWQFRRPVAAPQVAVQAPPAPVERPRTPAAPTSQAATHPRSKRAAPAPAARVLLAHNRPPLSGPLTSQERALVALANAAPKVAEQLAAMDREARAPLATSEIPVSPIPVTALEVAPLQK